MTTNPLRVVLIALVVYVPAIARAQDAPPPARAAVTVAEFATDRTGWMPPPHFGETVADLLAQRLVETGRYRVLDREFLPSPSINVAPTDIASLRVRAEQAGVQFVIVGSVSRYSIENRRRTGAGLAGLALLGVRNDRTDSTIWLTLRMVDVRTGEVVATSTTEGRGTRGHLAIGGLSLLTRSVGAGMLSSTVTGSHEA